MRLTLPNGMVLSDVSLADLQEMGFSTSASALAAEPSLSSQVSMGIPPIPPEISQDCQEEEERETQRREEAYSQQYSRYAEEPVREVSEREEESLRISSLSVRDVGTPELLRELERRLPVSVVRGYAPMSHHTAYAHRVGFLLLDSDWLVVGVMSPQGPMELSVSEV